ncbi:hypothetical protein F4804DRAFT_331453 [Jackrogersella minutella]|nr:hypothetical protein F4804DRAFT_331453 [Jackrogersella minutella]
MSRLPYQCLSRLGQSSILCAAKGTSIHTFDLDAGSSLISSWTHPTTRQASNETQEPKGHNEKESSQRPPKKRRLSSEKKSDPDGPPISAVSEAVEAAANGSGKKKPKPVQRPELPFVTILTATEDGSHVVAVTGQDKALWVFEHDGKGILKEISSRIMPKRPSSIAVEEHSATILSADKFGDVYSLPLVPSAAPEPPPPQETAAPSAGSPAPTVPFRPAANRLTVHSKRNLRALEEQERSLSRRQEPRKELPGFEHELILGHVSMLTALALAAGPDGRRYVVTGDRDEHVRVSRAAPQAHVVEGFCLGHGAFVNALCVPAARPGVLLSAGGDDEVFVWDWRAARLVWKVDVLARVREVLPDATRIAVARLGSYDVGGRCYVLAICERVPALFVLELLQDDAPAYVQTLAVPGSPLDAVVVPRPEGPLRLVVAVHPPQSTADDGEGHVTTAEEPQSLLFFDRDETGMWARQGGIQDTADGNLDLSREELENILYPVGKLRKTEFEDDAE